MKQAKQMTRAMKEVLSKNRLVWKHWECIKETDCTYTFRNKETGTQKVLYK